MRRAFLNTTDVFVSFKGSLNTNLAADYADCTDFNFVHPVNPVYFYSLIAAAYLDNFFIYYLTVISIGWSIILRYSASSPGR